MNRRERIDACSVMLGDYDEMFTRFVDLCAIYFDPSIDAAGCVSFDGETGTPMALGFNPNYIDEMDDYTLTFLIAHEICHPYFRHGERGIGLKDRDKANVTMDIAINHFLVDQLRFDRSRVQNADKLCWVDTVFKHYIKPSYNFEYYYNLDDSLFNEGFKTLDLHKFFKKKTPDDAAEVFATNPLPGIGDEAGSLEHWLEIFRKTQPKFEQIIKNKLGQICKKKPRKSDSWAKIDRRLCFLSDDLPVLDRQADINKPEKYKTLFFIDVSGSCWSYLKRFMEFAVSIPEDVFEVDFYIFDTKVEKIELSNKNPNIGIVGGGGTSFHPMVKLTESMEKKPDVIFVLTDGFAGPIKVKDSNLWHWFLIEGGSKSAIKGQGKIFKISQYE